MNNAGRMTLAEAVMRFGPPVRIQTGVCHDEDGWQAIVKHHFADGGWLIEYYQPAADEQEAERQAALIAQTYRKVAAEQGLTISDQPPPNRST